MGWDLISLHLCNQIESHPIYNNYFTIYALDPTPPRLPTLSPVRTLPFISAICLFDL